MPRPLLVACLVLSLLLGGCASRGRGLRADGRGDSPPAWVRYDDWMDNYPLVKLTALVLAVVAVGSLALWAALADDDGGRSPGDGP